MAAGAWAVEPTGRDRQYTLVNRTGADAFDVEMSGSVEVGSSAEVLACVRPGDSVMFSEAHTRGRAEEPVVSWADAPGEAARHEFRVAM
jgi:hypothetical protein